MADDPKPRRPLDNDMPDGYLESDQDFVINNLEWCVTKLEEWFEDHTEEAVEARISAQGYKTGYPTTSDGKSWGA